MSLESIYHRSPIWLQELGINGYGFLIGLHRYGRAVRKELSRIQGQEHWPRVRIGEHQDSRIRELVAFCHSQSPYYRNLFDSMGLAPQEIRGTADLPLLPLLSKEAIREEGARLLTRTRPGFGWLHGHTSGTTGSPLGLWYDRQTCIATNAVDMQQKQWGGRGAQDWIGIFLGRVVASPQQTRPPFWRRNFPQRQIWYSSFHLEDRHLPSYVDHIRSSGIRFLEGYPSTLFVLAQFLDRHNQTLPMESVFTSSETLHPAQKELIEQRLQCNVFDFFGHAERTMFGIECELHAGKHLAEDYGYVEVVNSNGERVADGDWGFLVGTSLHNRATPLLRYRTSDVSRIIVEPCACGRTSRRIAHVATKAEDLLVTPGGRMISPSTLTHPFKPFSNLVKSQIVQERRDLVVVLIVAGPDFSPADEALLRSGLVERLGPGISVDIQRVDEISRERSGKYRWVISKVAHHGRIDWEGEHDFTGE